MLVTLLVALLSSAEPPRPAPVPPITEIVARDGKLVVAGKDFRATAQRFSISPDGKFIDLRGTSDEPATLISGTGGPQTRMEITGQRIVFSPAEGTVRVTGAGKVEVTTPQQK